MASFGCSLINKVIYCANMKYFIALFHGAVFCVRRVPISTNPLSEERMQTNDLSISGGVGILNKLDSQTTY